MAKREDYEPPIRRSAVGGDRSPRAALYEMLIAPPAALGVGIALLVGGHTLLGIVSLVFAVIAIIQAVIYVPRALEAHRRERGRS